MKIALVTANIGGLDEIHSIAKQTQQYELFYFTENTLPFPLPNLDNRLKGKYFKTQVHRFLDHEIFIWIDGSIEVIDGHFITWVLENLRDTDMVITAHSERNNVYDEINYITTMMKTGSSYLLKRYAKQPFKEEYQFYLKEGLPENYPLYNCFFIARRNNVLINSAFNDWWDITLRYTNFDQCAMSYIAWKHQLNIKCVNADDYIVRHKHK